MKYLNLKMSAAFSILAMTIYMSTAVAQSATKKKTTQPPPPIKEFTIQGQVFVVTKGGDSKKLALVNVYAFKPQEVTNTFLMVEEKDRQAREDAYIERDDASGALHKATMEKIKSNGDEIIAYMRNYSAIPHARLEVLIKQKEEMTEKMTELELMPLKERKINAEKRFEYLSSYRYFIKAMSTFPSAGSSKSDSDGIFEITLPVGEYVIIAQGDRSVGGRDEFYEWLVRVSLTKSNKKIFLSNDNLATTRCEECVPLPVLKAPPKNVEIKAE